MCKYCAMVAACGLALMLAACDKNAALDTKSNTFIPPPEVTVTNTSTTEAIDGAVGQATDPDAPATPSGWLEDPRSPVQMRFPQLLQMVGERVPPDWQVGISCGQLKQEPRAESLTARAREIAEAFRLEDTDVVVEAAVGYCAVVGDDEEDVSNAIRVLTSYALTQEGPVEITENNVHQVGCAAFMNMSGRAKFEVISAMETWADSPDTFEKAKTAIEQTCSTWPTNGILIGLVPPMLKPPAVGRPLLEERYPWLTPHFEAGVPPDWRAGLTCGEVLNDETGEVLAQHAPRMASDIGITPQEVTDIVKSYCAVLGKPGDDVSMAVSWPTLTH